MARGHRTPGVVLGSSWRGLTDADELWVVTDIEAENGGGRTYTVTCAGGERAGDEARFPDMDIARLAEISAGTGEPFLLRPEETVGQLHAQRRRSLLNGQGFDIPRRVRQILTTYVGPDCCPADLYVVRSAGKEAAA